LWYAAIEPARPSSQTTKPEANGKATLWQGYVARDGFGITRIKNQIRANNPVIGNSHLSQRNLLFCVSCVKTAFLQPPKFLTVCFGQIHHPPRCSRNNVD
jgi:hypothetical protein